MVTPSPGPLTLLPQVGGAVAPGGSSGGYRCSWVLWKINQCGYKPDHRTEDNLFILKSLHEKYCVAALRYRPYEVTIPLGWASEGDRAPQFRQRILLFLRCHLTAPHGSGQSRVMENKNVYAAFVDFTNFFDSINRKFLFYKLMKYGITGNIYKIIKSMYSNARFVLVGGKISPNFPSNLGVKQGCPMSPFLLNIFQNDMHDIFGNCDPVNLGDTALNSLSWADDLLLLSLSKDGLQKCLNNLREYCQKWALTVNGKQKTKVMIFSKGKSVKANLTFGTNEIECVNNFHYLGFQISHDMKLKTVIDDRHSKATKMSKMVLPSWAN